MTCVYVAILVPESGSSVAFGTSTGLGHRHYCLVPESLLTPDRPRTHWAAAPHAPGPQRSRAYSAVCLPAASSRQVTWVGSQDTWLFRVHLLLQPVSRAHPHRSGCQGLPPRRTGFYTCLGLAGLGPWWAPASGALYSLGYESRGGGGGGWPMSGRLLGSSTHFWARVAVPSGVHL